MDNVFGNRKVEVINNNNDNNDYCTKIKEKYINDQYNEYIKEEYNKCFNKWLNFFYIKNKIEIFFIYMFFI